MTKKKNAETLKSEKVQEQAKTNDIASQKPAEDLKTEGTEEAPEPEKEVNNIEVNDEQEDTGSDQPEGLIEELVVSEKEKIEDIENSKAANSIYAESKPEPIFHEEAGAFPPSGTISEIHEKAKGVPSIGKSWLETYNTPEELKSIQDEEEDFDYLEDLDQTDSANEDTLLPDSSEFKVPLPANERTHVDAVLKSINENTAILRKKVILYEEFVAALPDSNEKEALDKKLSELHQ